MAHEEIASTQFNADAESAIQTELKRLWDGYFREKFSGQPRVFENILKWLPDIAEQYIENFNVVVEDADKNKNELALNEVKKILRSSFEEAAAEALVKQIRALGGHYNDPQKVRRALTGLAQEKRKNNWSRLSEDPVRLAIERVLEHFGENELDNIDEIIARSLMLMNPGTDKVKSVSLIELNNQNYQEIAEYISKALDGDEAFIAAKTVHFLHKKRDDLQEFYIEHLKDSLSDRPLYRAKKDIDQIFEEILDKKIETLMTKFLEKRRDANQVKSEVTKLCANTKKLNMPLVFHAQNRFWDIIIPKLDATAAKVMENGKANITKIINSAIDGTMDIGMAAKGIEVNINNCSNALDLITAFDQRPDAREKAVDRIITNIGKTVFADNICGEFYKIEQRGKDESDITGKQEKALIEKSSRLFELTGKLASILNLPDADNTAKTIIDAPFRRMASEYAMLVQANVFFTDNATQAIKPKIDALVASNIATLERRFQLQTLAFSHMESESGKYKAEKQHYSRMYSLQSIQMDEVKKKEGNNALADSLYEIETYDRDPKKALERMPDGYVKSHASLWATEYDALFRSHENVKKLADAILRVNNKLANEIAELAKPNYTAYHFEEMNMRKQNLASGKEYTR